MFKVGVTCCHQRRAESGRWTKPAADIPAGSAQHAGAAHAAPALSTAPCMLADCRRGCCWAMPCMPCRCGWTGCSTSRPRCSRCGCSGFRAACLSRPYCCGSRASSLHLRRTPPALLKQPCGRRNWGAETCQRTQLEKPHGAFVAAGGGGARAGPGRSRFARQAHHARRRLAASAVPGVAPSSPTHSCPAAREISSLHELMRCAATKQLCRALQPEQPVTEGSGLQTPGRDR